MTKKQTSYAEKTIPINNITLQKRNIRRGVNLPKFPHKTSRRIALYSLICILVLLSQFHSFINEAWAHEYWQIPVYINVVAGLPRHPLEGDLAFQDLRNRIREANNILRQKGIQLTLPEANVKWNVSEPSRPNATVRRAMVRRGQEELASLNETNSVYGNQGWKVYVVEEFPDDQIALGKAITNQRVAFVNFQAAIMGPISGNHFGHGFVLVHELIHNAGREGHSTESDNVMHETPQNRRGTLEEIGGYRVDEEDYNRLMEYIRRFGGNYATNEDQREESEPDLDQHGSTFDHIPRDDALAFWYAGVTVRGEEVFATAFTQNLLPRNRDLALGFFLKINVDGDDNTGYTEGEFIGIDEIHAIDMFGRYPFDASHGEIFGETIRFDDHGQIRETVPLDPNHVSLDVASMVSLGEDILPLFDVFSLIVNVTDLSENTQTWIVGRDYLAGTLNPLKIDLITVPLKPLIDNGPFVANTGERIQIVGSGFLPLKEIEILLHHQALTSTTANSSGEFQVEVIVPEWSAGDYMIDAIQLHRIAIAIITINVIATPSPSPTPTTTPTLSPSPTPTPTLTPTPSYNGTPEPTSTPSPTTSPTPTPTPTPSPIPESGIDMTLVYAAIVIILLGIFVSYMLFKRKQKGSKLPPPPPSFSSIKRFAFNLV